MRLELFNQLLESMRETGSVMRGKRRAHREAWLDLSDVKTIRYELGPSEDQFARLLGVRVATMRSWQQAGAGPGGPPSSWCARPKSHPAALPDAVMASGFARPIPFGRVRVDAPALAALPRQT